MKTDYRITSENLDMDLARMADHMAIEAANDFAAAFKREEGGCVNLRFDRGFLSMPTDGCGVSMSECEKCAHRNGCLLQKLRLVFREVATAAVCNVSKYYEKLEGGGK